MSYLYPVSPLAITAWNPPPGLSLALLLLGGPEFAPAVFVAAAAADVAVRGAPGPIWLSVATSLAIAAGYTLVALALLIARRRARSEADAPVIATVPNEVLERQP